MYARPRPALTRIAVVLLVAVAAPGLTGCSAIDRIGNSIGDTVERILEEPVETSGSDSSGGAESSDEGNTGMLDIAAGDCVNDGDIGDVDSDEVVEVWSLDVVDCAEPHDSEVYGVIPFEDDEFPGDDEVFVIADDGCFAAFEDYVGMDYESSALDFSSYTPTAQGWKYGDHEAMCVVFDPDGSQTTGSVKGSRR